MFLASRERLADLLNDEIESVLAPLCDAPADFYDLVKESLTRARRGLPGSDCARQWPLLPLIVCEGISGHFEQALSPAAAFQLFMAAADIFDDIEDADSSESLSARYGYAVATNVATALLVFSEKAVARLERKDVRNHTIFRVMDMFNSLYITACTGQHLDLSLTSKAAVSEDAYLKIAAMKSASTIECACRIGALLANATHELIDTFAAFGNNLGMASQIANDIHGVTRGSDIVRDKITVPVIYSLAQTDGEAHYKLELAFGRFSESVSDPTNIRDLLFRTGAMHYAMIKMELYKQMAFDVLSEAERAGARVEQLKPFLE